MPKLLFTVFAFSSYSKLLCFFIISFASELVVASVLRGLATRTSQLRPSKPDLTHSTPRGTWHSFCIFWSTRWLNKWWLGGCRRAKAYYISLVNVTMTLKDDNSIAFISARTLARRAMNCMTINWLLARSSTRMTCMCAVTVSDDHWMRSRSL
jgi:hypothetical protein